MVVYVVISVGLGVPLVSAVLTSTRAVTEGNAFNRFAERNRVMLSRVAREIRAAIAARTTVGTGGSTLTITRAAGVNGTEVLQGPDVRFELVPTLGESVNGLDDNGDGLVDEGRLVRRDLASGDVAIVASEISLENSTFALNGRAVHVALTKFGRLGLAGDPIMVCSSITVRPRN